MFFFFSFYFFSFLLLFTLFYLFLTLQFLLFFFSFFLQLPLHCITFRLYACSKTLIHKQYYCTTGSHESTGCNSKFPLNLFILFSDISFFRCCLFPILFNNSYFFLSDFLMQFFCVVSSVAFFLSIGGILSCILIEENMYIGIQPITTQKSIDKCITIKRKAHLFSYTFGWKWISFLLLLRFFFL